MAKPTNTQPSKRPAAGKSASEGSSMSAPGIRVRGFSAEFRRAGRVFTPEPVDILLDDLTDDQLDAIESEQLLNVQRIDMPVEGGGAKDGASVDDNGAGNA